MINPDKNIWGPLLWTIMHIASTKYNYHSQTKLFNLIFRNYIPTLIPCTECLNHYNTYINSENINPKNFEVNLYKFHNKISQKNGKKINSNYMLYHNDYSKYGLNEINIISNKLKRYYYSLGYTKLTNNVSNFINFINLNFQLLG